MQGCIEEKRRQLKREPPYQSRTNSQLKRGEVLSDPTFSLERLSVKDVDANVDSYGRHGATSQQAPERYCHPKAAGKVRAARARAEGSYNLDTHGQCFPREEQQNKTALECKMHTRK